MTARLLLHLALLAGLAPAHAQDPADPLKSPACAEALGALEAARAAGPAAIETRRRDAVRACLGGEPPRRASRAMQAPIVVPAPVIEPPAVRPVPPAPAPPAPPVRIERPAIGSHCDAGGCWVEDGGSHLRRVPQPFPGACAPMGPTVYCP